MSKKKTLEEFVSEFREKYPDKDYYDFSKSVYLDSRSFITVFCKKHNEYFKIRANSLLRGITSCEGCKKELSENNNNKIKNNGKKSFYEFLVENYSDIYSFNIDEYNGSHSKMTFIRKSDGTVKKYTPSELRSKFKIDSKQRNRNGKDPNWAINKIKEEEKDLIEFINKNYPDIDTSLIKYEGYRKKIILICKRHPERSFSIAPYTIKIRYSKGQSLCDICNKEEYIKNKTLEFVEDYNQRYPNNCYDFSKTVFTKFRSSIEVRCKRHNVYFSVRPMEFLKENTIGCPECRLEHISYVNKIREGAKFIQYLSENYPDIDTSLVNYVDVWTSVTLICKIHNIKFELTPWKIKWVIPNQSSNKLCPECRDLEKNSRSKLEKLISSAIRDILKIDDPPHEIEMKAEELGINDDRIKNIRADFILEYNNVKYWIEGNGPQHYKPVYYFHRSIEEYKRQLDRDVYVREYCKINNIILIEIPYTYESSLDKIKEILKSIILNNKNPLDVIEFPEILSVDSYNEEENKYEKRK